ncbi:MAG: thiamine phosphate synthase [Dehalococcoidia bacterium]|nr:thiamine phosphate synthase [Dehalococcoidia bacterium]
MPLQPLRIIDANLDRSSEGLRFLEDVARFLLNDATLSQQLRVMRHDLANKIKPLRVKLLSQRDSKHDVGANRENGIASKAKQSQQNLPGLIAANAKRVEEALRVVEELAKLPEISSMLDSAKFGQARFTLYALEKELLSRILRQDKIKWLTGLYAILDRQVLAGRNELDVASQIISGGARIIQLRDKQGSKAELLPIAQKLRNLCVESGVLFIINDHLDLALAVDADGLHIGQRDLPLPYIRKELPIDRIVGCSINTVSQAIQAQNEGADYIAVGSIFPTTTKNEATLVGIDRLKEVKQAVSLPLVAIGGINQNNIDQVLPAGADSIAVANAILRSEDITGAVQQLISKIELIRGKYQKAKSSE